MNSTLKILLAFKLRFLLIIACIACTFYIEGKLILKKAADGPGSQIDNTSVINNIHIGESGSPKAKSSLSYYKVAGQGQITDRLHIEIIL